MLPTDNFNIQKVLVAPLDWGLGHATRCIPLIRGLLLNGCEVVIAAEGAQAALLANEFPGIVILPLEGYRVRYSRRRWLLPFRLLLQLPRLLRTIRRENAWLQNIIREQAIQAVISDNRYGLYTHQVPCVFITHQLRIKAPFTWLEKKLQLINYRYINRFSQCWVPDIAGEPNLAGELSHPRLQPLIPVRYIGLLSRLLPDFSEERYRYCVLLSGPEPQRSLLEEKIIAGLSAVKEPVLLVRGLPAGGALPAVPDNVTIVNHLSSEKLQQAMQQSSYIISRSGYTTIMEIVALRKKALLIPTPGQTEQEYLAQRLNAAGVCISVAQEDFDCAEHLLKAASFVYRLPELAVFEPEQVVGLLKGLR